MNFPRITAYVIVLALFGCSTASITPAPAPSAEPTEATSTGLTEASRAAVLAIVAKSSCRTFEWGHDQGQAPAGYTKGMALTYGKAVCDFKKGTKHAQLISKPFDGTFSSKADEAKRDRYDGLSYLNSLFEEVDLTNDGTDLERFRNTYLLEMGLGMQESSGRHCCGRDPGPKYTDPVEVEAGAWQTSFNSLESVRLRSAEAAAVMSGIYSDYKAGKRDCLLKDFQEGVNCNGGNWTDIGTGPGKDFQAYSKACPAFAADWATVVLRFNSGSNGHYGPILNRIVDISGECGEMLAQIESVSDCGGAK